MERGRTNGQRTNGRLSAARRRLPLLVAALALTASACGAVPDAGVKVVATAPVGAAGDAAAGPATPSAGEPGETHEVLVTGDVLPPFDDSTGAPDPGVGLVPPALDGQTFDGSPVAIHPGSSDHFQVVFFFAHWCPHCRREVPRLVSWLRAGSKPANVDVMAVSTAVNRSPINYPPSAWFATEGLDVPIMTDDEQGTAAFAWGLPGYPYVVVLKPDGSLAARRAGEFESVDAFDAWVHDAITSTPR